MSDNLVWVFVVAIIAIAAITNGIAKGYYEYQLQLHNCEAKK